jgi:hypothetical protein
MGRRNHDLPYRPLSTDLLALGDIAGGAFLIVDRKFALAVSALRACPAAVV